MPDPISPFLNARFPVGSRSLAAHANVVTCVLVGRTGPLHLTREGMRVEGDLVLVRPGIVHSVALPERGADVLYLNGLSFPFDAPLAQALSGKLAYSALAAMRGSSDALADLRSRLTPAARTPPPKLAAVVRAIYADPMRRMPQAELASRLSMERTQAQRYFKSATGLTFRAFKSWSALQHATQAMAEGALVRTAAMDAGFADTAHLSHVFQRAFGLTPSAAIAGLALGAGTSLVPRAMRSLGRPVTASLTAPRPSGPS